MNGLRTDAGRCFSRRMIRPRCAVAALLVVCACAADKAAPEPPQKQRAIDAPTPADVAMRITALDDGQNVTVKVGTKVGVELAGIPTAGYLWAVTEQPAFLEAAGEYGGPTSTAQLQEGFTGGRHWEGFLFNVTAAGEGALRLEQKRPWEDDEPPADEFSVYLFAEE